MASVTKTTEKFVPTTEFVSPAAKEAIERGESVCVVMCPRRSENEQSWYVCAGSSTACYIPVDTEATVTAEEAAIIHNAIYARKEAEARYSKLQDAQRSAQESGV